MPFTFSHPAAVLPLRLLPRHWFSLTGLVIGSMVPDFEYFLRSMRLTVNGRDNRAPISVPTRDRGMARGVAVKGQSLDPRNLTLSIVRAAGSVAQAGGFGRA